MVVGWEIAIIFGLILANGFFAAAEIAILTARRSRLETAARSGDRAARIALRLAEDPNRFLQTVQIGITLVGTLASAFGGVRLVGVLAERLRAVDWGPVAQHAEAIALGIVVLAITYVSLLFGELVPKRLALGGAERLAKVVAVPMQALSEIARPFVWVMGASTQTVLRMLRIEEARGTGVSVEDIEHLIRSGEEEGVLEATEQRAATRALHLGERTVREVMRPRVEIDALDVNTPADEVVGSVVMSGFSRVPVYEDDLDNIVGFVYNKDLMRQLHMGWPVELRKLLRPVPLVPKSLRLDQLLDLFRSKRTQMAVILDEYGGTAGLVTMEDVLEELVGEIHEEHRDDEPQEIVRRGQASWSVDAAVSVNNVLELVGRPELRAMAPRDVSTVAGLIQTLLGRIAVVGDRVGWNDLTLEVVETDGLRVERVLVTVREAADRGDE